MPSSPLAELRARRYKIAVAEAADPAGTLDPNDPETWGLDPDMIHDMIREERP
jgi:hypothetical protein